MTNTGLPRRRVDVARSRRIAVAVTEEEYASVDAIAAADNVTISSVAREALLGGLSAVRRRREKVRARALNQVPPAAPDGESG